MIDIMLSILVVQVHTCLAQFLNHIDLQKAGEVIFNNDKYNLLKPTKHIITHYSKEFMLRHRNKNIPTDRIFIDNNGFRHFWSGFDETIKNLRYHEVDTQKKNGANFDENVQRCAPRGDSTENINQNYTVTDFTESSSDITIPTRKNTSLLWHYYDTAKYSEAKPKLRKAKNTSLLWHYYDTAKYSEAKPKLRKAKNTSLLWHYYDTAKYSEAKPKLRKAKNTSLLWHYYDTAKYSEAKPKLRKAKNTSLLWHYYDTAKYSKAKPKLRKAKNTSLLWHYYDTAKYSEAKPKLRKAKNPPEKDNNIKNKAKIAKPKKVNNAAASKVPNTARTKKRPSKSTSTPKPKRHNTAAKIKPPPTTKPKNKIIKNTTTSKTKKVSSAAVTKANTAKSKTKSIKNATAASKAIALKQNATEGGDGGAGDRTVAHTTFFCPFLGVVTMSAFVD